MLSHVRTIWVRLLLFKTGQVMVGQFMSSCARIGDIMPD
jgi:hypothetical protein